MVRLLALFLMVGVLTAKAEVEREYILVSGGPSLHEWEKFKAEPHDRWWGNFIRAARVRIQEIQARSGPGAKITWLVHKPSYVRRSSRQDKQDLIDKVRWGRSWAQRRGCHWGAVVGRAPPHTLTRTVCSCCPDLRDRRPSVRAAGHR
jgi:hypothetical protein